MTSSFQVRRRTRKKDGLESEKVSYLVKSNPSIVTWGCVCEHDVLDAVIPKGSIPPHGSIPQPPPKSKPVKDETDIAEVMKAKKASENAKRKIYYQRNAQPSKGMVNIRIMLYDMRQLFKACVKLYLEITGSSKQAISRPAPTSYPL